MKQKKTPIQDNNKREPMEEKIMIVELRKEATKDGITLLKQEMEQKGAEIHVVEKEEAVTLMVTGDMGSISTEHLENHELVESIKQVKEPYKKANRKLHPEDSCFDISGKKIGAGFFQMIAGPCSVESEEQIIEVAQRVKAAGAGMLRGGAFKPRTSPYAFQGLQADGIELLLKAKEITGLPIVTEIMSLDKIDLYSEVDLIQVGTRNMQNFELLKELGKINKPILLKRGMANTLDELLMSVEYIMAGGNDQVILCERGIRTFETSMRNTLDISAIPMLKQKTHLPVVIDPSHAAGLRFMVEPLAMASIAAGADGLMVEVHNDPDNALCDGPQSLTPDMFDGLMEKVNATVGFFGKINKAV